MGVSCMTHKEKVKECRKYKAKLAMAGKKDLADNLFEITVSEVKICISILAKIKGYPETLYIPDFVDSIRW